MFKSLARATLSVAKTTCNASALRVATQIPKRFMGHHIPAVDKEFAPIDPTEHDRSITLAFNKETNQFEPIVIAAVERSFEFLHSSPVDVHNFDVLPVVKDCLPVEGEFDYEDY